METTKTSIWYIEERKRKSLNNEYNITKCLIETKISEIENKINFLDENKLQKELNNLKQLKYYLNNFETIKEHLCGKIQCDISEMD